jgi:hypothetical protein
MPVSLTFDPNESIHEIFADLLTQYEDQREQAFLERWKNPTMRIGPIIREADWRFERVE